METIVPISLNGGATLNAKRTEELQSLDVFDPVVRKTLRFDWDFKDMDFYSSFRTKLEGQAIPTARQALLFLDAVSQNLKESYGSFFNKFQNYPFLNSTQRLVYEGGVFVYDDPFGDMPADSGELAKMYASGEKNVRFVHSQLPQGKMKLRDFLKDENVIATLTLEGIPVLERIARRLGLKIGQTEYFNYAGKKTEILRPSNLEMNDRLYFSDQGRKGYTTSVRTL